MTLLSYQDRVVGEGSCYIAPVSEPTVGKERLKKLRALARRKGRDDLGLQLLEGRRLVEEALLAGRATELFVRSDCCEAWRERAGAIPVHPLSASEMERLADVRSPQEAIAVGPLPEFLAPSELLSRHDRILVLDSVQDPGNVGTLCRTSLALGVGGVLLLPGTADPTAPKVLRASVGTLLKLDLARAEDVSAVLQSGHVLVLPVVRGGADIRQTDVPDRYALVAGNESAGTSIAAEQALSVTIPMAGGVESLNVAAACAVILGRWA